MKNYKITKSQAEELQKWGIDKSGAKPFLAKFPEYDGSIKRDGLYADYHLDESEFYGGMDYPDLGIVSIIGIFHHKSYFLGEIRAYNHETFWLSTLEIDEFDDVKEWIESIQEDYANLAIDKKNVPLLSPLLKKDSSVIIENLKSIIDKEEEYSHILYAIEESVTNEYLQNKKIKDKEIISYLNNFLKNINAGIEFFKDDFEKYLYGNIVEALQEKSVTAHELKLCIKYILWSIDNRNWLDDSQAYVKWLTHSTGVMDSNEKKAYETKVRTLCKRKGIPKEQVDAMLKNDFTGIDVPDKESSDLESVFFALDDDKKLDFVIENFEKAPFLGEEYFGELLEKKDYDAAEKLCRSILEIMPDFAPMENLLGIVYKEKGNPILAKIQFERALNLLDEIPPDVIPEKDLLIKQTKKLIEEVSK